MSTLPTPAPVITTANEEFWKATAQGRFVLQRCTACEEVVWFPRRHCPHCWTEQLASFDAKGTGIIYSYTVIRKGAGLWKDASPFVVAYVELAEGPRVMTNIVECDNAALHIGMPVEIVFHDTGEGNALYRFRPVTN